MKIHIYLFAYIFIYNEKHIYNIDGVRGVRGVGGLAGSSGFGVRGSFPPFVSPSSFLTWWWVQLCPRLAQHRLGFAHLASFRWLCLFFVVFAIGLLRRFFYPILDPLAFVPNTFYLHA